jgi:predicted transcriptional regulator
MEIQQTQALISKNSDRFLSAFNNIHVYIKKASGSNRHIGFMEGLNKLRTKNYILNRYFDDLQVFNDLRNVIVHQKKHVEYVIAEPHMEVVNRIEKIASDLTQPVKIIPKYRSEVKCFHMDDSLATVLLEVKSKGYSQFPIYDHQQFAGLLTENGIANWLSRSIKEDLVSISETKVKDVIEFEEMTNHYLFVSKHTSVFEAKEKFLNHLEKGSLKLDALLITEHGKETETLLGIITPWDVLDI